MWVVKGPRQYSTDLEQGGLDVPCKLIFSSSVKEDFKRKVQSLLQRAPKLATLAATSPSGQIQQNDTKATSSSSSSSSSTSQIIVPPSVSRSVLSSTPTIEIDDTGSSSSDESDEEEVNPTKRAHVDGKEVVSLLEGQWLQIEKCLLTSSDQDLLIEGKRLNDHHVNFAQCLLKKQFNTVSGLQLTSLQDKKQPVRIKSGIQIVYLTNRLHWCVASTVSCQKNEVKIYDSIFSSPDSEMRRVLFKSL